jgi:putative hydrolase of the HAD superfamily
MINTVLFDFGGVIAREGFREGLKAIAGKYGLDPDRFFETARDLMYSTEYVVGKASEAVYWDALRKATGTIAPDEELREDILERFTLNPGMIEIVDELKRRNLTVGILSDQTNWLDELDGKYRFSSHFGTIFNSFYLHKSKKDPSLFREVAKAMGQNPEEILFIDDSAENAERAASQGMKAIHYQDMEQFRRELEKVLRKE